MHLWKSSSSKTLRLSARETTSPTVRKLYAEAIKHRLEEKEQEKTLQAGAAAALAGKSITFAKKTTKTGKLYAAVSEKAISETCKAQLNLDIAPENIQIPSPIKAIGTFTANITLGASEQPLTITITAETAPKT
ncbi:hypothetical protein HYW11_02165 [Candidatus Peregrinibacteria bacterium]|nr:hypothetical protein [Candidatus Peregrinibacteria bacterium]